MRPSCTSNKFAADAVCETAWTEAEARELLVDYWKRGPRNSAPASARPMNRMTPMMPISTFDMVTRFLLKAGSFELGLILGLRRPEIDRKSTRLNSSH